MKQNIQKQGYESPSFSLTSLNESDVIMASTVIDGYDYITQPGASWWEV